MALPARPAKVSCEAHSTAVPMARRGSVFLKPHRFSRGPGAIPNYIQMTALRAAVARGRWMAEGQNPSFKDSIVIDLCKVDLLRARNWELSLIRQWICDAWAKTIAPIWLSGDWVEAGGIETIPSVRGQRFVVGVLPFLSGLVSERGAVAKASTLNAENDYESLVERGLLVVLSTACIRPSHGWFVRCSRARRFPSAWICWSPLVRQPLRFLVSLLWPNTPRRFRRSCRDRQAAFLRSRRSGVGLPLLSHLKAIDYFSPG